MKKILIISVTAGKNFTLAKKIQDLFDIETGIISLEDYQLPLYTPKVKLNNQNIVDDLCNKVTEADGFVFCGPEYNGGSAPILTNAITWISVSTTYWRDAFNEKIGLLASHSGGGGESFLMTFRKQLEFLGVIVFPRSIMVNKNKAFSIDTSKKIVERFQKLI